MWAAGVIVVNEEKRHAAEIRWARERSFRREKVRQKGENWDKACRLHGKVQEMSLKERYYRRSKRSAPRILNAGLKEIAAWNFHLQNLACEVQREA